MATWFTTCLLITAGMVSSGAMADVLRVPDDYPTIQTAIDAAKSGDEITIASGVYEGEGNTNVLIDSLSLTIRSVAGGTATIMGGGELNPERGFELRLGPSHRILFDGIRFRELRSAYGGAMLVEGGRVTLVDCSVEACGPPNDSDNGSGAVTCLSVQELLFTDCTFSWNTGPVAALTATSCDHVEMVNCELFANSGWSALAVLGGSTHAELSGCRIYDNFGDLLVTRDAVLELRETVVVANGPALTVYGDVHAVQSTVTLNSSVAIAEGGSISLDRSIVSGNCNPDFIGPGDLRAYCSALDSTGIMTTGSVTYDGEQVWGDPEFCDPKECGDIWEEGDLFRYWLAADSRCLEGNSPCGERIGAFGLGCGDGTGACCVDIVCQMTTAEECAATGGRFLGGGTSCETDSCVPTPTLRGSWGQMKGVFR